MNDAKNNAYATAVMLAWSAADTHEAYAWVMRNAVRQVEAKSAAWNPEAGTVRPGK